MMLKTDRACERIGNNAHFSTKAEAGILEMETCTPEEAGIPNLAIGKCLRSWERHRLPIHSFLIVRSGKIAAEYYCEPYTKDTLHRLYSVTKSFVSLAIGCLAEEGKLRLDDPVTEYFPEYLTTPVLPWLKETTIRHMLQMASCHSMTTYKKDLSKNWVESFFQVSPDHKPGTVFSYDTSSSHTLCALAEKLTGMSLLDYSRSRFLNQIGFSQEAYIIKDAFGVSMGGTGLMAKPEDMARTGLLLLNGGRWKGRQLLPEWYVDQASSRQIANCVKAGTVSQANGYGYQFWCLGERKFACWGKGGQWIICLPEYDMVCVTTADTEGILAGDQRIIDGIFNHILPALDQETIYEKEQEIIPDPALCLKTVQEENRGKTSSPLEKKLFRARWQFEGSSWISEMILYPDPAEDDRNRRCFSYRDQKGMHRIYFGMIQAEEGVVDGYGQPYSASGTWLSENTLYIRVFLAGEEPCQIRIQIVFSGEECTMYLWNTGELLFTEFSGWYNGKLVKKSEQSD